jgi:hypothetical protein
LGLIHRSPTIFSCNFPKQAEMQPDVVCEVNAKDIQPYEQNIKLPEFANSSLPTIIENIFNLLINATETIDNF